MPSERAQTPRQPVFKKPALAAGRGISVAFGEPRNYLHNRYIYLVISQRAHGLSLGVNLNPNQICNFSCVYCEVKRSVEIRDVQVDLAVMSAELSSMLEVVRQEKLHLYERYRQVPADLLQLREVAISGDGEPTLCPNFAEAVQTVVHLRAQARFPFFKLVLITNGTGLHLPSVRRGLCWFTDQDDIWVKLDVGTQAAMERINRSSVPLSSVLANILALGRERAIVIQSLFPMVHEQEPDWDDIEQYVQRLAELKAGGANISLVQVYSAHRPTATSDCSHLSLHFLSQIAARVRAGAGLVAEVF
jgi:wyosine [tRNA(Phe)-imidazoG37] synthetase (radical SAM superfamily)